MDMPVPNESSLALRVGAGVLTALIGAIVMAIPLTVYNMLISGHDVLYSANIVATWVGFALKPKGWGSGTLFGIAIYVFFSTLLGAIWGLVFRKTPDRSTAFVGGMIYGIVVYWLVEYLAAPLLNPPFTQTIGLPMLIAYLAFGACFALYPFLLNQLTHRLKKGA